MYLLLTPMLQMEVGCPGAWGLVPLTQTQVEHPMSQPYPQPSHEPRPQNPASALAPMAITLRLEVQWKTLLSKAIGRGGRGEKALKSDTTANATNAEQKLRARAKHTAHHATAGDPKTGPLKLVTTLVEDIVYLSISICTKNCYLLRVKVTQC